MTRIFTAAFWSAILSVRHDQIRLCSLIDAVNVHTCKRPFMEFSCDPLNGKLFEEEDYGAKEECKQEPAEETDDLLRIIAGRTRLPTTEKRLIRDPDRYGPGGQGDVSVQNFQPIDVAPATNGHKTNSVSKDGRENATFISPRYGFRNLSRRRNHKLEHSRERQACPPTFTQTS